MEFVYNLPYYLSDTNDVDELSISGIPDIDREILLHADHDSIIRACATNKYLASICKQDGFWRTKILKDYTLEILNTKPESISLQEFHKLLSYWNQELINTCTSKIKNTCMIRKFWTIKLYDLVQPHGKRISELNPYKNKGKSTFLKYREFLQYKSFIYWYTLLNSSDEITSSEKYEIIQLLEDFDIYDDLDKPGTNRLDLIFWFMTIPKYTPVVLNYIRSFPDLDELPEYEFVNYLTIIEFLFKEGFLNIETDKDVFEYYAELVAHFKFPMFERTLIDTGMLKELDVKNILSIAAKSSNISLIYKAYLAGYPILEDPLHDIILNLLPHDATLDENIDNIGIFRFMYEKLRLQPSKDAMTKLVRITDNIDDIKWLKSIGGKPDRNTLPSVLQWSSNTKLFEYLYNIGASMRKVTPKYINVDTLSKPAKRWLRKKGWSRDQLGV